MGGHARIGIRHPIAATHRSVDLGAEHVGVNQALVDATHWAVGVDAEAPAQRPRAILFPAEGPGVDFPHQEIFNQARHRLAIQHGVLVGQQHRDKEGVGQRDVKFERHEVVVDQDFLVNHVACAIGECPGHDVGFPWPGQVPPRVVDADGVGVGAHIHHKAHLVARHGGHDLGKAHQRQDATGPEECKVSHSVGFQPSR